MRIGDGRSDVCSCGLEGLENVFARHYRHAEATRRAVTAWGLEILCREPNYYSSSLTAVLMPEGQNADDFRRIALEKFDISLGTGLTKLAGRVFSIGPLGDTTDLTNLAAQTVRASRRERVCKCR